MTSAAVEALVRAGRLERVVADREAARSKVEEAQRHLGSASRIAKDDPAGAYALLYDAARKAIHAHMLASGLRATNRAGAHDAVGRYAEAVFSRTKHRDAVSRFDRMRRNRNRSEYGSWHIGASTVAADLGHAKAIVDAVGSKIGG